MPETIKDVVPQIAVGRLPLYLRALRRLQQQGCDVIASHELGKHLGIGSAQIRKDLSYFGGLGKQGTGYSVAILIEQLSAVLAVDQTWSVAVIGAGNIGTAISKYEGFTRRGFHICWVFDSHPDVIGTCVGDIVVQSTEVLERTLCRHKIQIVMIAVPAGEAQQIADRVIACGVCAILNYAPIHLHVPDYVKVQYIDPIVHLQSMTYYL